jgi:hypothetical protein
MLSDVGLRTARGSASGMLRDEGARTDRGSAGVRLRDEGARTDWGSAGGMLRDEGARTDRGSAGGMLRDEGVHPATKQSVVKEVDWRVHTDSPDTEPEHQLHIKARSVLDVAWVLCSTCFKMWVQPDTGQCCKRWSWVLTPDPT